MFAKSKRLRSAKDKNETREEGPGVAHFGRVPPPGALILFSLYLICLGGSARAEDFEKGKGFAPHRRWGRRTTRWNSDRGRPIFRDPS